MLQTYLDKYTATKIILTRDFRCLPYVNTILLCVVKYGGHEICRNQVTYHRENETRALILIVR